MADLDDLLVKTSRTFALSIPVLPEPTRRQVTTAYLLFRIADTLEDAAAWPAERRVLALSRFCDLLDESAEADPDDTVALWLSDAPSTHAGYLELLRETPFVLGVYRSLDPAGREAVRTHLRRTASGMAAFVARSTGFREIRVEDLDRLREYCYTVAGLVGEMLTELFLLREDVPVAIGPALRRRAARFGEGLQLVNILKDAAADRSQGRRYLPAAVERRLIFALARRDLDVAAEYVAALERGGAPRGLVEFTALPVRLARASLDRVERDGAGSKLTRGEVLAVREAMDRDLDAGEPAVRLDARAPEHRS